MVEAMRPEDWTQLSGLTHLTLRDTGDSHAGTLVAALPRLTALQSLELPGCLLLPAAGAHADNRDCANRTSWSLTEFLSRSRSRMHVQRSDAADLQLGSLSRLTHLDLGYADGVPAVAPQLPNLRSLALHLSHTRPNCDGPLVR
jgi:hypothetical protein